ncbi:MAG TPA: S8 family serine peptidase [Candidatus Latescibacteria bacterium]|nr:S8 family serine peptidase [Candidatus Latescibacterota bacterium]
MKRSLAEYGWYAGRNPGLPQNLGGGGGGGTSSIVALACVIGFLLSSSIRASPLSRPADSLSTEQLVVKVREGMSRDDLQRLVDGQGLEVERSIFRKRNDFFLVRCRRGDMPGSLPWNLTASDVASRLPQDCGDVLSAHPVRYIPVGATPNDTLYDPDADQQWEIPRMGLDLAWDLTTGTDTIRIGIIDTGVDTNHADLVNALSPLRWNFVGDNPDVTAGTTSYHGTRVSGVAAGVTNNTTGLAGTAGGWSSSGGARLMALRAGSGSSIWYDASALEYAIDNGAHIVNMSYGGLVSYEEDSVAVADAYNAGIVLVGIAHELDGGDPYYGNVVRYPARYPQVIAVGGMNYFDDQWGNWGNELDIVSYAAGSDPPTARGISYPDSGGGYGFLGAGHSVSAPRVCGVIALMMSVNPNLVGQPEEVRRILCRTADRIGWYWSGENRYPIEYTIQSGKPHGPWHERTGYGNLNAFNAVARAKIEYMESGQSVELTGDVIVNMGDTLTVPSGVTLKFAEGKKLLVHGRLVATNVTFTRIGTGGLWGGIEVDSANASVSLTGCTVEYAANGVHCNYASSANQPTVTVDGGRYHHNTTAIKLVRAKSTSGSSYVRAARIDNNTTGIRMENCSVPIGVSGSWAYRDSIHDNTGTAIYLVNAHPNIYRNKICNNGGSFGGIYCSGASPNVDYNNIWSNGAYGIYCSGSYPDIKYDWFYGASSSEIYITGSSQPWMEYTNIHSSVYGDDPSGYAEYAVTFNSSGYLECENNWYGDASPVMSAIVNQTGRLIYNYPILSSPARNDYQKPARTAADANPQIAIMREAGMAENEERFVDALAQYREVVERFPESPSATRALGRAFAAMGRMGASQEQMEVFFSPLSKADSPLSADARYAAAELCRRAMAWHGDFARAIRAYRVVAQDTTLLSYQREAAWLQIARLADEANDDDVLFEAVAHVLAFGDSTEGAMVARLDWPDMVFKVQRGQEAEEANPSSLAVNPNPFNPTTSITYRVTAPGNVSVQVFNALGQRVRDLVNTTAQPGTYTVVWDGRDGAARPVGSGVYLIRFMAPQMAEVRRVTLVR